MPRLQQMRWAPPQSAVHIEELMDRQVTVRTYLDFEKPVAELESKVAELKAIDSDDDAVSITDEVTRLQQKAQQALDRHLRETHALAEDPGCPPSGSPALPRLRRRACRGFHAARR